MSGSTFVKQGQKGQKAEVAVGTRSPQSKFTLNMTMSSMFFPITKSESNRTPLGINRIGDSQYESAPEKPGNCLMQSNQRGTESLRM